METYDDITGKIIPTCFPARPCVGCKSCYGWKIIPGAFEKIPCFGIICVPESIMAKAGPIVLIEDDSDDREVFQEILKELNVTNKIICFSKCDEAFHYLETTTDQPFLIFSDVNLPMQNGIEFKRQLDSNEQLRKKSIPFIFYSTSVAQKLVNEAFTKMTVQGFFQKANSYEEIKANIRLILDYWSVCKHPNV